ncbi:MAG: FAD-binding oxidoreductase [Rhizobacter sp.]|nr:FAD-binding oxidoreductase [Ferruginibacter sp.]
MKHTLKKGLLFFLIILLLFIARPAFFLLNTYYNDKHNTSTTRQGYINDASRLNETKVEEIPLKKDSAEMIQQIIELIKQAGKENKKISIAGARHSMGGHTLTAAGIMLNMSNLNFMKLDSTGDILTVGAGALWSQVIPFLDKQGKSVLVMQSNNSFSVGGSVSVNCHGWQVNSPPIAATVESFRLIDAKGQLLNCSRTENAALFSLALGGYGLFGVIADVNLRVTDNKMYKISSKKILSKDYRSAFDAFVGKEKNGMAYGRINVTKQNFMEEAIITKFTLIDSKTIKPLEAGSFQKLRRTVFRGSAKSDYGKKLRWSAEKFSSKIIQGKTFSRNQLQNEGVEVFENTQPGYTDILHEYFILKDNLSKFIEGTRKIIPAAKVDLLNITVRNVKADTDVYLAYANEEVFGFVMLFNQATDSLAEKEMILVTQQLIDLAINCKGKYYLPYRLHATKDQMIKAYPNAKDFFILKKNYDPQELFQNKFYQKYK